MKFKKFLVSCAIHYAQDTIVSFAHTPREQRKDFKFRSMAECFQSSEGICFESRSAIVNRFLDNGYRGVCYYLEFMADGKFSSHMAAIVRYNKRWHLVEWNGIHSFWFIAFSSSKKAECFQHLETMLKNKGVDIIYTKEFNPAPLKNGFTYGEMLALTGTSRK